MRVEVVATSLVAVLGTLLGSVATYWIQRSTVRQQEGLARAERLRQERVEAFTGYGGALHDYRVTRGLRPGPADLEGRHRAVRRRGP